MLEKIFNITPNTDFKGTRLNQSSDLIINRQFKENSKRNDSMNFSPAFLYLKNLNWKLNQFKVLSSKKVFCSFDVHGFKLETVIDAMPTVVLSEIYYNISEIDSVGSSSIIASFKVLLKRNDIEEDDLNKLSHLSIFFGRANSLNIENELNLTDSDAVTGLLEGIGNGIYKEFCYINYHFLNFIEKMINIKLQIAQKSDYHKVYITSIKTLK